MNPAIWFLLQNTFWAGVAALGFAILFNMPVYILWGCALSGAIGYGIRTGLVESGWATVELATLLSATAVSFLGVVLGRWRHAPALLFVIPGMIPLVPGALAFRTMIDILTLTTGSADVNEGVLVEAVVHGIKTILILGAIAGGIAVPTLLLRRHRPLL
jgi:uncharacterized membrane protein YjjB (DUF3815 family)